MRFASPGVEGGDGRRSDARYPWRVLAVVCLAAAVGALDMYAVNLSLPVLAAAFESSVATISWVALAHLIALGTGLTIFGRLSDLIGARRVFLAGIGIHLMGSLAAASAPALWWLVGARVVTGLGASMTSANSIALLGAVIPPQRRGAAIGILEASVAVSLAAGPVLSGLLIESIGWRAVFFLVWPGGLLTAVLAARTLRDPPPRATRESFDLVGAATFAGGTVALLLGLTNGAALGWGSPWVRAGIGAGLGLLALFLVVERRVRHPMIDLRLFHSRTFSAAAFAKVACYLGMNGALFLMPFYFQRAMGLTPAQIGSAMLPVPIAHAIGSLVMGPLSDRVGARAIARAGLTLATAGSLLLARLSPDHGLVMAFGSLMVLVLGLSSFISPNDSVMVGATPPGRLGVASGILALTRNLGMILGTALTGTVLAARQPVHLAAGLDASAAFLAAFHEALLAVTAVVGLGALATFLTRPRGARDR